jgi:sterol desaturase/sphingolipid hydroxylase (fatty acid hydroxylase superfamily)
MHIDQQFARIALDIFKLCVWLVLLAVIFGPFEWAFGIVPSQTKRTGLATDLGYYFLNNVFSGWLQIPPLVVLGWGLHFLIPAQLYTFTGSLPLWARLAAGLALGDLGYYWAHRLMHRVPLLWRFHSIHHSATRVDWLVSSRAHPLDIAFSHFFGLVPLYALGLTQPFAGRTDILPQLFIVIGIAWGFFIHANLNWQLRWIERLVSTPAFHHWHHTKREYVDRNFASLLPCIDIAFDTYHLPKQLPSEYGITDPMPSDMLGQLMEPFRLDREPMDGVWRAEGRPPGSA